ncbi:MAG: GxxExxY protein [Patescibacteria group bacterium]|jgi:GxxExxY protein
MAKPFLEPELSYKLMGIFYDLRNKYGRFRQEKVYDRALDEQLAINRLEFIDKPKISIYSMDTGQKIGLAVPDKLVANKIIVEIKAKPFTNQADERQIREYLQTSTYEIIYLVNFGEEHFQPRRFILTNDRKRHLSV